jgi:hypothetical protein
MIGITGRWAAGLSAGGSSDIISTDEFRKFKLVESTGNTLPDFEFNFCTSNPNVITIISENIPLSAGMGIDSLALTTSILPLKKKISRATHDSYDITVSGLYNKINYMTQGQTGTTPKMSAMSAIVQKASEFFNMDVGTSSSNDSQNWVQHGIPALSHIQKMWTRADLGSSNFPMIGITSDGTFRLRTLSDLLGAGPSWVFSVKGTGGNVIAYNSDYVIENNSGFTNYWAGYQSQVGQTNIDSGSESQLMSAIASGFGISAGIEQSSGAGSKLISGLLKTANQHDNYHQAHINNVANLAVFSSNKLTLSVSNIYFPIKVLDVATFLDDMQVSGTMESYSGNWIVTKVARCIQGWKFNTTVEMCRDSANMVSQGLD